LSGPIAIRVEGIGKEYVIDGVGKTNTLRETLGKLLRVRQPAPAENPMRQRLWALKEVSFEVERGEIFGIIGQNGCGKSTLLKILSRIIDPTQGRAEIYGRVGALLELGTGFHPDLTGRENIYMNGAILGMNSAEISGKFDDIVAFSEVENFIDMPVKHYSSGMYVRLAFGVAAYLEPEILLIDEVLAVGDTAFQQKCLDKMHSLMEDGRTVLMVSHNLDIMRSFCTRCMWLDHGRMQQIGGADDVVDAYLSSIQDRLNKGLPDAAPLNGTHELGDFAR